MTELYYGLDKVAWKKYKEKGILPKHGYTDPLEAKSKALGGLVAVKNGKVYAEIPFASLPTYDAVFLDTLKARAKSMALWEKASPKIFSKVRKNLDLAITSQIGEAIIKDFYSGDQAAQREAMKKFGKEAIEIGMPKRAVVEKALADRIQPISEWNTALADALQEKLTQAVREGAQPSQLKNMVIDMAPKFLAEESVTIQRPGKKAFSMNTRDYTDLLARTLPFSARNEGYLSRMKQYEDMYEGWISICPDDERSCEYCLQKMQESEAKPFNWGDEMPPYHPNCFIAGTKVYSIGDILAGWRGYYKGPVIKMSFSDKTSLTVTPNQPILTPQGFVVAYLIESGNTVLSYNTDDYKLAEDLFKMGEKIGIVEAGKTFFYGDGEYIDGAIDIARYCPGCSNTTEPTFGSKRVTEAKSISYSGFIYDFESISGKLVCNGIVISNCRCRPEAKAKG